jgi:cell wall-associated NlpC family hydrolase
MALSSNSRLTLAATALLTIVASGVLLVGCSDAASPVSAISEHSAPNSGKNQTIQINGTDTALVNQINGYTFSVASNPARVEVFNGSSLAATFTDKCYTVSMTGPSRTFDETNSAAGSTNLTSYSMSHNVWVRKFTAPFSITAYNNNPAAQKEALRQWLYDATIANQNNVADVLKSAMQYIEGASAQNGAFNGQTVQIYGDASYTSGGDYNDYMQVTINYTTPWVKTDAPEANENLSLDCSGFMRMIWGVRNNSAGSYTDGLVPLSIDKNGAWDNSNNTMTRTSYAMYANSPGVVVITHSGAAATGQISKLNIGDLVFFDDNIGTASSQINHVGMYIGQWTKPGTSSVYARFISSRTAINGPTMGDYSGASLLNYSATSKYTKTFCAARRL